MGARISRTAGPRRRSQQRAKDLVRIPPYAGETVGDLHEAARVKSERLTAVAPETASARSWYVPPGSSSEQRAEPGQRAGMADLTVRHARLQLLGGTDARRGATRRSAGATGTPPRDAAT